MKFWLKGNVTIPQRPRTVGGLLSWARGVNRALAELRDMKIVGITSPGKKGGASPPKLTIKQGTAADKFQIVPGTVNLETPTLGGTLIEDATPPEITVTEDTWCWLKVVGTFGSPDTFVVTIETTSTSSPPADEDITGTGFTSYRLIGSIDFTAGTPDTFEIDNAHSGGNLGVDSIGLYNIWYRA